MVWRAVSTRFSRSSPTAIDEAREGYGKKITVTRYLDYSVQVEDQGRGIPVDYNPKEERYNWELVFCEMYAGGKYNTNAAESYEFSLGLNGLGLCATQYASEYMDVDICRDGFVYDPALRKGRNCRRRCKKEPPPSGKDTGTTIRWKPDLEVFTDIDCAGGLLPGYAQAPGGGQPRRSVPCCAMSRTDGSFDEQEFFYENGIRGLCDRELGGEEALTPVQFWSG